jgi:hypothetical protein
MNDNEPAEFKFSVFAPEIIAQINENGDCIYNWPAIHEKAKEWKPYCMDMVTNLAKLLDKLEP